MEEIVKALGEQHGELGAMLASLGADDWERDTPCDGWTVTDVVLHLAQTDELAIGSVQCRFADALDSLAGDVGSVDSIDAGAASMVERDRDQPTAAIHARWERDAATLRELFAACDPHDRLTWVAGELSARTLATTRLAECWIHTGDVAAAVGRVLAPPPRLRHVARLAWRTLPYAFARDGRELSGPVAFELLGPDGDPWTFHPDAMPTTTIRGDGVDLCLVAARRVGPGETTLHGEGPDAEAVLDLVRTYA